eukprot:scaffold2499_cov129-Isochrysis_galbana.AAC.9
MPVLIGCYVPASCSHLAVDERLATCRTCASVRKWALCAIRSITRTRFRAVVVLCVCVVRLRGMRAQAGRGQGHPPRGRARLTCGDCGHGRAPYCRARAGHGGGVARLRRCGCRLLRSADDWYAVCWCWCSCYGASAGRLCASH